MECPSPTGSIPCSYGSISGYKWFMLRISHYKRSANVALPVLALGTSFVRGLAVLPSAHAEDQLVTTVRLFRDKLLRHNLDARLIQPSAVRGRVRLTPVHRCTIEVVDSRPCLPAHRRKKQTAGQGCCRDLSSVGSPNEDQLRVRGSRIGSSPSQAWQTRPRARQLVASSRRASLHSAPHHQIMSVYFRDRQQHSFDAPSDNPLACLLRMASTQRRSRAAHRKVLGWLCGIGFGIVRCSQPRQGGRGGGYSGPLTAGRGLGLGT
jgi:hypothetical protein